MDTPVSRSFLQGLPELRKQQEADQIVQRVSPIIQFAAGAGYTSYTYEHTPNRPNPHAAIQVQGGQVQGGNASGNVQSIAPVITDEDLVAAFKRKFPDCAVSYEETWVDVTPQKRILKKGIRIDWS
jgi:hypothetical protein